jgi:AcrR family transcriptional regulator
MPRKGSKPPRRRAKQERAHATLEVVLEAAAHVLLRHGYARATTNRIAEAAGVSVGTIYQYFPDKDAIFDALIRREIGDLLSVLSAVEPTVDTSLDAQLRHVLRALVAARPDAPALYRSLEQVPNALFRRLVSEARGGVVAWVRSLLAAHRDELRVDDLDVAAFIVVATAEGVALNATPAFFRDRGADELATMLGRYLLREAG